MQPAFQSIQSGNGLHTGDRLHPEVLHTRLKAIEAYERHTGFTGIGNFFAEQGLIIVANEETTCTE